MKVTWIILGALALTIVIAQLWEPMKATMDRRLMASRGREARGIMDAIYEFAESNKDGSFPSSLNELGTNMSTNFVYVQPPPHNRSDAPSPGIPILVEKPGHYRVLNGGWAGYAGNIPAWRSATVYPKAWEEIGNSSNKLWHALHTAQKSK